MLSGIRKAINSKVGLIVTFIALGVIALAFALTDINMVGGGGGQTTGQAGVVAQVGNQAITERSLQDRMRNAVDSLRQQYPTLTMTEFVAQGGLGDVLQQMMNGIAFEIFGEETGLVVSQRLVDGQIASIPAFQAFDGSFSQTQFEQALAQQGITAEALRQDIARETIARWLITPTIGARQVATGVALPYASLLLERRQGAVAFVPTAAMDPGAPATEEQLKQYYEQNRARYTVPERRVARYATISRETVAQQAQPTDAEIAQLYEEERARFAPTEQRTIRQVISLDRNIANQIVEKVRAGTGIEAAASAAGLAASTAEDVTQQAYAAQTNAEIAQAAFAAEQGAVVGPVAGTGNFFVLQVASVEQVPGRTLAEVRDELAATLSQQKTAEALGGIQDRIDEGLTSGATFDEIVRDLGLEAQQSAALFADGRAFGAAPDAEVAPLQVALAQAAFNFVEGDQPQLVPVGEEGSFALVALGGIQPAAPRPLAEIREGVANDYRIDNAKRLARQRAEAILRAVNQGTPIARAASTGGVAAEVETVNLTRGEFGQRPSSPALAALFSLSEGDARVVEAPSNSGFYIVQATDIESGSAAGNEQLVNGTRQALGGLVGQEYVQQFAAAIRQKVGATRNEAAITELSNSLTGTAAN